MKTKICTKLSRAAGIGFLLLATLSLSGCSSNIGVGVSVGVPIGNYGHISIGSGRHSMSTCIFTIV